MEKFKNRTEAGKMLAKKLQVYAKKPDTLVLALPRGGVPVAYEIAKALSLPLDVFIVRKLGMPGHEEFAMGAIAPGNVIVINEEVKALISELDQAIQTVIHKEQQELKRREEAYRGSRPFPNLANKTIILVDDGVATGATVRAAIKALRLYKPKKIILAVPVAAFETCRILESEADDLVTILEPENLYAVGAWYSDFSQTTDEEVFSLLAM